MRASTTTPERRRAAGYRLTALAAAAVLVAGAVTAWQRTRPDSAVTVATAGTPETVPAPASVPGDALTGLRLDQIAVPTPPPPPMPPPAVPAAPVPPRSVSAPRPPAVPALPVPVAPRGVLVSASVHGGPGNGYSTSPSATADGRLVAFVSYASDLVPGDTNQVGDVFVRDTAAGTTTRILGLGGEQGNGRAGWAAISADGTRIAFLSEATNLVDDDTNGRADLFVHNVASGTTFRHHAASYSEISAPALSSDGSTIAFHTEEGLFVGAVGERAEVLPHRGGRPSLSADGRFVSFGSSVRGLAPGDEGANADVYVYDRHTRALELASGGADGSQPNANSSLGERALSADGRRVTFLSVAGLVPADTNGNADVYVRDLATSRTLLVPAAGSGGSNASYLPSMAADGSSVGYFRPQRAPHALRWQLGPNTVGPLGPPTTHGMEGLQLIGSGYVGSTSDATIVGGSGWHHAQIVLVR